MLLNGIKRLRDLKLDTLKNLFFLLGAKKKIFIIFTGIISFSSLLEALGIGSLYPIVNILETRTKALTYVEYVNQFLPFSLTQVQFINLLFVGLLFLFLIRGIFMILSYYLQYRLSEKLRTDWQIDIFESFLNQDYSYFIRHKTGDLIQKQMAHTEMASSAVVYVCEILRGLFTAIFLFITLWIVSWPGAIFLVFLLGVITLISLILSKVKIFVASQEHAELQKEAYSIASEVITGIRQVKAFLADKFFLKNFSEAVRKKAKIYVKNATWGQAPGPLMQTLVLLGLLGVLFYITRSQGDTQGLLPIMTVFGGAAYRIIGSVSGVNGGLMQLTHLLPSTNIVATLIKINPPPKKVPEIESFKDNIKFENVNFSYPGKSFYINNFNLRIEKGKFYGVVGVSGSGKSTLVDLLIKFYSPTRGKILVNEKNLEEIETRSWRKQIGLISQETFIFNGTILENISFAVEASCINMEKVIAATKIADLHQFIESLPAKYQTIVGERGLALSGGERQRLAIARAVYRDPLIYIFDEATSSLDVHSEQKIQKSIEALSQSKTIIAIAHRLSTVINADEILVIKGGQLVEKGSHKELLAKGGYYAALYDRQKY